MQQVNQYINNFGNISVCNVMLKSSRWHLVRFFDNKTNSFGGSDNDFEI